MPLKIFCKNIVKIVYTYHFLKKKKNVEWNNGNGIAEIEGKKIVGMDLWQWHCRNRKEKKIVVIDLPKIGGERELFE